MTLVATCHCGGTRIELPRLPERRLECNCTFCAKAGAVWGYLAPGEVTIARDEHGKTYSKTGMNLHHFCANCGMQAWTDSPDWADIHNADGTPKEGHSAGDMPARRVYAINLQLLDDFDLTTLTAEKIDGRNSW